MIPIVIPVGSGELKYATGSKSAPAGQSDFTVSGLGFRPYAVWIQGNSCLAVGLCDASGTVVRARFQASMGAVDPASFVPGNDGFVFSIELMMVETLTWYAIGK